MLEKLGQIGHASRTFTGELVRMEGVDLVFAKGDRESRALNRVSITIQAGSFTVVSGPTASGKSSLINILGGLMRPTRGQVWFAGERLDHTNEQAMRAFRRDRIGFVFGAFTLVPNLSPIENVELVGRLSHTHIDPIAALDLAGIRTKAHSTTADLNDGERQQVMLARAIVKRPDLLLCDNPLATINKESGDRFLAALGMVNEMIGTTVVLATSPSEPRRIADHVIKLANGRVIQDSQTGSGHR